MLFNSLAFLVFFPLVAGAYAALSAGPRRALLLGASFLFYGWWDWRFLGLMIGTALVDFVIALRLDSEQRPAWRLALLRLSLVSNLGVLGVFKYFGFFVDSALAVAATLGVDLDRPVLEIVLPVGISFYTFQALSYTIDVYRGHLMACRSASHYLLYIAFFPQLVAGPIERATHLLPQLETLRSATRADVRAGIELIIVGFFKKVAIADVIAPLIEPRFANPLDYPSGDLLIAVYLFSLQIYCDFSGYSDIARGVARFFGCELMLNFTQPYLATSITEFWRRWHVSLSGWLRDYLYVPLGGNRGSRLATYRNLMLTMLLGGLWHGAAWTFVIWGGLHGLYLALHKFRMETFPRVSRSALSEFLGWFATFHLVALAWVFFRSPDLRHALWFLEHILTGSSGAQPAIVFGLRLTVPIVLLVAIELLARSDASFMPLLRRPWYWQGLGHAALTTCTLVFGALEGETPFIYFQF